MAPATRKSRTASKSSDQMKIFLRVNSTISVKVKPSDTFCGLKYKISRKLGIPKDSQALLYETSLRDDQTLSECFIKNGSILDLAVLGMQIFVKVPSRTREILELRVKELDTIQVVKSKIHEELEIPPDKQSTLTYSGIPLEDGNTVASYKIKKESTLVLAIHQTEDLKVFFKLPNKNTITLDAKIWYSVGEVKSMIESMVNLQDPRLLYLGKNLEDIKSLADYKIKQGGTIIVMSNMYILVRTLKGNTIRTIKLGVDSSDPIEFVKEKLIKIEEGIHASKLTLIYAGRRLEDGMTLADYDIHKGSVLYIVDKLRGGGAGENPNTVNKVNLEPQDQSDPEGEPGSEEESDTKSDTENDEEESEAETDHESDEEESEAETDHESDKEESEAENDQGNDEEEN